VNQTRIECEPQWRRELLSELEKKVDRNKKELSIYFHKEENAFPILP